MIEAIFAMTATGGIGLDNKLPWGHNKIDLAHFKEITEGHIVVMGRKTWDSLPKSFRPLPDRTNVVLSRRTIDHPDVRTINMLTDIPKLEKEYPQKKIFIIGGKQLLEATLDYIKFMHVTIIKGDYESDVDIDKDLVFKNMHQVSSVDDDNGCIFEEYAIVNVSGVSEIKHTSGVKANHKSTLTLKKKS